MFFVEKKKEENYRPLCANASFESDITSNSFTAKRWRAAESVGTAKHPCPLIKCGPNKLRYQGRKLTAHGRWTAATYY